MINIPNQFYDHASNIIDNFENSAEFKQQLVEYLYEIYKEGYNESRLHSSNAG